MFVAEITDAFSGLTQGVLKGILPGIDVAAFYGYCGNPNIITAGFLWGTIVMIIMTILGVVLNAPVIVMMGFTQMMFDNASAGMFGHHRGGIKGLIFGASLTGVVDVVFGGLCAWVYGLAQTVQGVAAPFDQSIMMSTVGLGIKYLGIAGLVIWCVVMIALPRSSTTAVRTRRPTGWPLPTGKSISGACWTRKRPTQAIDWKRKARFYLPAFFV